jgi:amphi-Trp domain-containing protein
MSGKQERDIERGYAVSRFVAKLRRLANALERGEKFEIQIAGERIYVPVRAEFNVEHEREDDEEEIEFQIKWTNGRYERPLAGCRKAAPRNGIPLA